MPSAQTPSASRVAELPGCTVPLFRGETEAKVGTPGKSNKCWQQQGQLCSRPGPAAGVLGDFGQAQSISGPIATAASMETMPLSVSPLAVRAFEGLLSCKERPALSDNTHGIVIATNY